MAATPRRTPLEVGLAPLLAIDPVSALLGVLPGNKRAPGDTLSLNIIDSVVVRGGKLFKWLYTAPNGAVADKVHVDRDAIHAAFRQHGGSRRRAAPWTATSGGHVTSGR